MIEPVTLSVSVVTGADEECVRAFLESLRPAVERAGHSCETTVIVNSGSIALAERVRPIADHVQLREYPWGFAKNHNEILRRTGAKYHLIANDDVIVDEAAIDGMLKFLELSGNERIAVVSPKLLNPDLTLQPSTYGFPTVPSVLLAWSGVRGLLPDSAISILARLAGRRTGASRMWRHDAQIDVETLRGAFTIARMEAVRDVGLMSEIALVGGEEVEWHARMASRNWRVVFLPSASVIHRGRVTTGGRSELEVEYVKGTLNFFALHRGRMAFEFLKVLARVKIQTIRARHRLRHGTPLPMFGDPITDLRYTRTTWESLRS